MDDLRPRYAKDDSDDVGTIGTAGRGDRRGRSAMRPSDIPARSWKDIVRRVYRGITDDRILANAGAVVFYALLALFPGIAALVSIYALFADPRSIAEHLDTLAGILPGGAIDIVRDQLGRLTSQPAGNLGIGLVISLGVSLWSANGGIKALFDALNVVYREREARGFILLNAVSLVFTVGFIAFLLLALAALIALPAVLDYLPASVAELLDYARWPVLLVVVAAALALIYRYGPSRAEPRWRWISWGSIFAALGWIVASALFSWYATNFGSFNKTYGSLGAVIGFMMWMWLSVIVVLIGGRLNAEIERQTTRDSTEGRPELLGRRGASMADTVGQAQD